MLRWKNERPTNPTSPLMTRYCYWPLGGVSTAICHSRCFPPACQVGRRREASLVMQHAMLKRCRGDEWEELASSNSHNSRVTNC